MLRMLLPLLLTAHFPMAPVFVSHCPLAMPTSNTPDFCVPITQEKIRTDMIRDPAYDSSHLASINNIKMNPKPNCHLQK
jgi:hypothetical protein